MRYSESRPNHGSRHIKSPKGLEVGMPVELVSTDFYKKSVARLAIVFALGQRGTHPISPSSEISRDLHCGIIAYCREGITRLDQINPEDPAEFSFMNLVYSNWGLEPLNAETGGSGDSPQIWVISNKVLSAPE